MNIRPLQPADIPLLTEIDGTVNSASYFHVEVAGEGAAKSWRLDERPLRSKLVQSNPLDDERRMIARQIASGADEGTALLAEHEAVPVALLLAQPRHGRKTLKLVDLRVDFDHRREGLASALVYQLIQIARDAEFRAISAQTSANNSAANSVLLKLGFELTGLDTHRYSNHDLVKEAVTLFWYVPLD